ncbi:hypothetical protein MRB53_041224 [Persea americana]|nr:hypothetical protein MRB53_041224 [Persea americana]
MNNNTQAALQGCVQSLQSSMQLLDSSLQVLDNGVHDFPRLIKVLQATKHFELISESSLQSAQQSILPAIENEVNHLLDQNSSQSTSRARSGTSLTTPGLSDLEALKMEQLRQKKQRLSYAVGRLELQANQRERQLRKSMAVMHDD